MDPENLKGPLKNDCGRYIPLYTKYKKITVCSTLGIFLYAWSIIVSIAFVFGAYNLSHLDKLEKRVELLESTLLALTEPESYDDLQMFENEDMYTENPDDVSESQTEKIFLPQTDDLDYDINYEEYGNYDSVKMNSLDENKLKKSTQPKVLFGGDFTKQGIETSRSKRNVIAATRDGIPINSESYAAQKRKNDSFTQEYYTSGLHLTTLPYNYRTNYHQRHSQHNKFKTSTPVVLTRQSRVMHKDDKSKAFRRVVKKSQLRSGDYVQGQSDEQTFSSEQPDFKVITDDEFAVKRYRPRGQVETLDERPKLGRMKPLPTVHLNGDTSKYVLGQHSNFNGNGHLRHHQRTFIDWKASDWVSTSGMTQHFSLKEGILTVKESGLYFVYAQIFYLDEHDTNGYRVYKNEETLLQCTTTIHSTQRVLKGNTCYTAGATLLSEGDKISVGDLTDGHYSLFEPGKSFFGLIKLGDIKVK